MSSKKRGQAALEYLIVYGWALLVVIVVISTMAYFGLLNPSFFIPERCTLPPGFECKDYRVSASDQVDGAITLKITNAQGKDTTLTYVEVTSTELGVTCSEDFTDQVVIPGNPPETDTSGVYFPTATQISLILTDTDSTSCVIPTGLVGTSKKRFKIHLEKYDSMSGQNFVRAAEGTLIANIEP